MLSTIQLPWNTMAAVPVMSASCSSANVALRMSVFRQPLSCSSLSLAMPSTNTGSAKLASLRLTLPMRSESALRASFHIMNAGTWSGHASPPPV